MSNVYGKLIAQKPYRHIRELFMDYKRVVNRRTEPEFVTCWINGKREFYDNFQEAFEIEGDNQSQEVSKWSFLTKNRDQHYLNWMAAHDSPPIRHEKLQVWPDSKTYECHLRSQYTVNAEGDFETTNELIDRYGTRKRETVYTTNGLYHTETPVKDGSYELPTSGHLEDRMKTKWMEKYKGYPAKDKLLPIHNSDGMEQDVLVSSYLTEDERGGGK